jgi:hypothetical protein
MNPYFDGSGVDAGSAIQQEEITFGLERDLQIALRRNIDQLEPGLKIVDGGTERTVEAGRIDITAEDEENKLVPKQANTPSLRGWRRRCSWSADSPRLRRSAA